MPDSFSPNLCMCTPFSKHEPPNLSIVQASQAASQAAKVGVQQLTSLPHKIAVCATLKVNMSHQMSVLKL